MTLLLGHPSRKLLTCRNANLGGLAVTHRVHALPALRGCQRRCLPSSALEELPEEGQLPLLIGFLIIRFRFQSWRKVFRRIGINSRG